MTALDTKAVIFDCDGTLALTANLHFDAFNAALARQGAYMDRAWYDARKGLDRNDLIAEFAAQHDAVLDCARIVADSRRITVERAEQTAVENPPVAALARRLKGKVPIAVGSNAETDVVRSILRGAGLDPLFEVVVTVVEALRPKPDPAIFLLAAERLAVAPGECLVLEDSEQGLQAAIAAGMDVLDVRIPDVLSQIESW
ncbi:HAD family hydrolase [Aliiruegeria lutimaris]|uniref:Haloacid dehalogenase superfamily, subfamily IA, variant 3 with third motif having DD or ED n=1 Tax=Aliiruegeria lutimaris TaxID=571298 RepID=A0A1G8SRZ5_9RHOB|nr:HAD family phosphatase [Aliiruegeria lutimaris]SDJ31913.1 haloacid dehalogenase superfamily, subfamily IA, variant 3 with third motif having DD or ED [Aliiruegeria lutimaris]